MNLIPHLHVPEESHAIWGEAFTPDDLEKIAALGELSEFKAGSIGGQVKSRVDEKTRDTAVAWLRPGHDTEWLYNRMTQLAAQINHDKFQLDLDGFQDFQYGRYEVGGHYDWHKDSGPNTDMHRKLSFVLALNDPSEYTGGEFELNVSGDPEKTVIFKIQKNQMVVFPAHLPHRVRPVTSGVRITLVAWAVGPKLR